MTTLVKNNKLQDISKERKKERRQPVGIKKTLKLSKQ
jgi:hypothetical protein